MPVAHTFDLPSRQPLSSTRVARSGTVVRAVVLAALAALILALVGGAYFGIGSGSTHPELTVDGYPEPFPLWTD
jgi:hypothetical protein